MAVLQLDPTKAPDFSSTSRILAQAGLSMERGFGAARGMLGSYQEGVQEKVDNEVFAETAGMNREQLQAFFDKNGLKGRNISAAARERLGGQAAATADINRTRGLTESTAEETLRLNAVRAEDAAEEQFRLSKRGANISNAALQLAADAEKREGVAATPGADALATAGGTGSRAPAHLVRNESGGSFQATNEAVGSGGVKGHDGRVQAGAARITDAKNAGVLPKDMTREQFRNDPAAQVAFENWHFDDIDANIEKNGYDQYIGTKINGVTVTHAGLVDVQHLGGATGLKNFLESGGRADPKDENGTSLTDYLQMGGKAAVAERVGSTGATAPLQASAPAPAQSATPAGDRLRAAQIEQGVFTGGELLGQEASLRQAEVEGKAVRAADRADALNETRANIGLQALEDAGTTEAFDVSDALGDIPGQTAVETLASLKRGQQMSEDFSSILKPGVIMDPMVEASVSSELGIIAQGLEALPQTHVIALSKQFKGDPTQGLIGQLELDSDPENPDTSLWGLLSENGMDDNILRELIKKVAEGSEPPVTHEIAAAAMAQNFRRNPWWFNTANRRFQPEKTIEYINKFLSPDAMRAYEGHKLSFENRQGDFKTDVKQLNDWMVQRKKMVRAGTDTKEIDGRINKLELVLKRGQTRGDNSAAKQEYKSLDRQSGMIDRFKRLSPNAPGYEMTKGLLVKQIHADGKLTNAEKRLLLAEING